MTNIIEVTNVSKKYKNFHAVDHISLSIKKGAIFGLIGPNGAGKSTFMKVISGLIHESEGEVRLFGHLPKEDAFIYRRIGTLIENAGLYPNLNAYDNIKLKAIMLGYDQVEDIQALLVLCGIQHAGKKKVKNFSMGMKQRLGIAIALLGNPELLILDEPTNGLDPQGIQDIRNLLVKLNREKQMTIIISSHILEELSKIANDYGIIKNGKLIERLSSEELEERCRDCFVLRVNDSDHAVVCLEEALGIKVYEILPNHVIHLYDHYEDASKLADILVQKGIRIYEMYEHEQDLESYFLMKSGNDNV